MASRDGFRDCPAALVSREYDRRSVSWDAKPGRNLPGVRVNADTQVLDQYGRVVAFASGYALVTANTDPVELLSVGDSLGSPHGKGLLDQRQARNGHEYLAGIERAGHPVSRETLARATRRDVLSPGVAIRPKILDGVADRALLVFSRAFGLQPDGLLGQDVPELSEELRSESPPHIAGTEFKPVSVEPQLVAESFRRRANERQGDVSADSKGKIGKRAQFTPGERLALVGAVLALNRPEFAVLGLPQPGQCPRPHQAG